MLSRPKKKSLEVNVSESISVSESLFNLKPWFNGLKKFVAIRLE